MQIAICDDDRLFLERFRIQVEELGLARKIDCYSTLKQFIYSLDDGIQYDAVLMDIDWKQEETGMDAAEKVIPAQPADEDHLCHWVQRPLFPAHFSAKV